MDCRSAWRPRPVLGRGPSGTPRQTSVADRQADRRSPGQTMHRLWRFAIILLATSSWFLDTPTLAAPATVTLPQGITAEGHHSLGRADAPVTLVEYGDFL